MSDFIRQAWYVAGRSADFAHSLKPMTLLGERIVLFRRRDGGVTALDDACPHRKLPLSKGRIEGDRVVCGYHGLTFDETGRCVAAPTQESAIPKSALVESYPTVDRYGFLWIWMGDPEAANPDEIIEIPEFDNPSWGKTELGALDIACNYLWVTDNLLDPSHVAWVHRSSFGGAGTENVALETTAGDDRLVVWRWIADRPPPPYYGPLLDFTGNCDRKQHYECRLPSIAINRSIYAPAGSGGDEARLPAEAFVNVSYNFLTPVDEDATLYFWFQHRNSHAEDQAVSDRMFEGAVMAFNEDKEILEAVHQGMKAPKTRAINLGLDAGAVRFRKLVAKRIAAERAVETLEA